MPSSFSVSAGGVRQAVAPGACDEPGKARFPVAALLTALVFYAILVCGAAVAQRDQINPDGIAYIRNAVYLSEGRLLDSVSGYWSPLLSWSLAPFMYFGFDGLYASRVVLGVWGAILVVGSAAFVGRCTTLVFPWNMIVLMLVSLAAAQWATTYITPDLLLGALLMWYFGLTARSDILLCRRRQVLAGAVGGLAYLAKSYAFPFFVTHYSFSVLLHFAFRRPNAIMLQAIKALAIGFTGFAVIAGAWVGVLSSKSGGFTVSTVAAFAHYLVGPPEVVGKMDVLHRAQTVPPGRITVWETPENLDFKDWSPFASSAFLTYQVKHVMRNCARIVRSIAEFDRFAVVPGFLLLMVAIRLAANQHQQGGASPYPAAWSLMTVMVYAGGFLPIVFEARYIEPVLWPICCVLVFGVLLDARRLLQTGEQTRPVVSLVPLLSVLCALSFACHFVDTVTVGTVRTGLRPASVHRSPYRDCGNKLVESGCAGPVAACEGCWHEGLYVSYHASLPFLGEIRALSPAAVEKSLEEYGAQVFVANSKWGLFEDFGRQTKWQLVCTSTAGEDGIMVFLAPSCCRQRSTRCRSH